jgi:hypothetical protein
MQWRLGVHQRYAAAERARASQQECCREGSVNDDKQRLEFAKWLFERTLGWIATADVKVGVAMALDTAMLGGLAAAFSTSAPQLRTAWCYLAVLT